MATGSQKITELDPGDLERLAKQRTLLEDRIGDERSRANYGTPAGKLGLIRALLAARAFRPDQTYVLQSMGVVFGDALAQELGFRWVMVEDEYGRDPALKQDGSSIILYPLTMISKRVERGETVDVFALFNEAARQVDRLGRGGLTGRLSALWRALTGRDG